MLLAGTIQVFFGVNVAPNLLHVRPVRDHAVLYGVRQPQGSSVSIHLAPYKSANERDTVCQVRIYGPPGRAQGGAWRSLLVAALQRPARHHPQVLRPANVGPEHDARLVYTSESGFQHTCAVDTFPKSGLSRPKHCEPYLIRCQ